MPELPWVKWYPTDWASEPGLRLCSLVTRAVWFEALNTMMLTNSGSISGTLESLSILLRCTATELQHTCQQLVLTKVGRVFEQNGNITIENRRMARELEIKELRRKAGIISAQKRQQSLNRVYQHPSASASASASVQGESEGETHLPEIEIPSLEEVLDSAKQIGLVEWKAKDFFNEMQTCGWLDAKKRHVMNWRAYLLRVKTWWESDGRPMEPPQRKNGGPVRVFPETQLKQVEDAIARHPCNPQSVVNGRVKITTELKAEYANLRNRLRELKSSITATR